MWFSIINYIKCSSFLFWRRSLLQGNMINFRCQSIMYLDNLLIHCITQISKSALKKINQYKQNTINSIFDIYFFLKNRILDCYCPKQKSYCSTYFPTNWLIFLGKCLEYKYSTRLLLLLYHTIICRIFAVWYINGFPVQNTYVSVDC